MFSQLIEGVARMDGHEAVTTAQRVVNDLCHLRLDEVTPERIAQAFSARGINDERLSIFLDQFVPRVQQLVADTSRTEERLREIEAAPSSEQPNFYIKL